MGCDKQALLTSALTARANSDPHGTSYARATCDLSLRVQSILLAKFAQWPPNSRDFRCDFDTAGFSLILPLYALQHATYVNEFSLQG